MESVQIAGNLIGDGCPCFIVAEIGINHNGSIEIAKQLINVAKAAGCDAVKFQKRTVDIVYSPQELAKFVDSPFGNTYCDLKRGLEFGLEEYKEIDKYCHLVGIPWFASCWDEESVDFIEQFKVPCYKIASATLTNKKLLRYIRLKRRPVILSTGMSTLEEVDQAVEIFDKQNLILLHTVGVYPAKYEYLNLRVINTLKDRYNVPVGYSGHETGLPSSVAAVAIGACVVERHITLDRAIWGTDQAASLEPNGITRLVRDIRLVEKALGTPEKKCLDQELQKKLKYLYMVKTST